MDDRSQLVPGSGEGQHTETVDDLLTVGEEGRRIPCHSPSPLVTISYYSIPAGMLGRGPHNYQPRWR